MEQQKFRAFYLGEDPFTAKVINALLAKTTLEIGNPEAKTKNIAHHTPGDIMLIDQPGLIQERKDVWQVLISSQPLNSPYLKYWCKAPLNEENIQNLMFFLQKKEFLIIECAVEFHFSVAQLHNFLGDDLEDIREIVSEFITNLQTNFRHLERSIKSFEREEVRKMAHKMLSGSEYYQVKELSKVLRLLEPDDWDFSREELCEFLAAIYHQVIQLRSGLIQRFF